MARRAPLPAFAAGVAFALGVAAVTVDGRAATTRVVGNVLQIDLEKRELTILDAGRRHRIGFDDATQVRQGTVDRTISDLHRGDRVVITLDNDSAGLARRIAIAGPGDLVGGSGSNLGAPAFSTPPDARTPIR